jgi:hypothetical protein
MFLLQYIAISFILKAQCLMEIVKMEKAHERSARFYIQR